MNERPKSSSGENFGSDISAGSSQRAIISAVVCKIGRGSDCSPSADLSLSGSEDAGRRLGWRGSFAERTKDRVTTLSVSSVSTRYVSASPWFSATPTQRPELSFPCLFRKNTGSHQWNCTNGEMSVTSPVISEWGVVCG